MINHTKNKIKLAFSLVEMMLLLMIVSLVTAGSMSIITKKHSRVPKKVIHGKYTCYYTSDGNLWEERYVENSRLYKRQVNTCTFEPPAKATYFYIQLVGGGGAGGDAGYEGGSRTDIYDSGTKSPFSWSQPEVEDTPFYMTVAEWRALIGSDSLYVCAYAGSGGAGSGASSYVKSTTLGRCTCPDGNIYSSLTTEQCTAKAVAPATCLWEAEINSNPATPGGSGGAGAYCKSANVPVDFGLSETHSGGSGGVGYSSYEYINHNYNGQDGSDGSASISQNDSTIASCHAYAGTGGTHASQTGPYIIVGDKSFNTTTSPGTNGDDGWGSPSVSSCSTGYYLNDTNGGSYPWTHQYQENYMTVGEGGYSGEYLAMFVRSFKSNTIDLKPGKGGAAPDLSSGANGADGEATSMANGSLSVPGGVGGKGKVPTAPIMLPPNSRAENASYQANGRGTHTGISPNYQGHYSSYTKAANVTGMDDIPPVDGDGIDLTTFGRGGNGGTSQNNCWIGAHVRTFKGTTLNSSFPASNIKCSDSEYSNAAATAGAPGSIVIVW